MKEHHLQLNLAKTELLIFPATPTLPHDFIILLGSSKITLWWPLEARSCRFALHNIRRIRPFQTEHAAQLLVQALIISRLDYCNALLAGLPSCANKPQQMFQNAAAQLVFHEPKRAHFTPLLYLPDIDICMQNSHRLSSLLLPPHSYESTSPPEAWDL